MIRTRSNTVIANERQIRVIRTGPNVVFDGRQIRVVTDERQIRAARKRSNDERQIRVIRTSSDVVIDET